MSYNVFGGAIKHNNLNAAVEVGCNALDGENQKKSR
jgi:hypothetical protein